MGIEQRRGKRGMALESICCFIPWPHFVLFSSLGRMLLEWTHEAARSQYFQKQWRGKRNAIRISKAHIYPEPFDDVLAHFWLTHLPLLWLWKSNLYFAASSRVFNPRFWSDCVLVIVILCSTSQWLHSANIRKICLYWSMQTIHFPRPDNI